MYRKLCCVCLLLLAIPPIRAQMPVKIEKVPILAEMLDELLAGKRPFEWARPGHRQSVELVRILPDGRLLSIDQSKQVCLWEFKTAKPLTSYSLLKGGWAPDVSSGGETLGMCSHEGVVLYDVNTGREIFSKGQGRIESLAFSPREKIVAVIENELKYKNVVVSGRVRLLDYTTGANIIDFERLSAQKEGFPFALTGLVFSPDGALLATGGNEIRLWDIKARKMLRRFGYQTNDIWPILFTPDGQLVTGGRRIYGDGHRLQVNSWDVQTGRMVNILPLSMADLLSKSTDGRMVALKAWGPDSGKTVVREWPSFKKIRVLESSRVTSAVFSPANGHLLIGQMQGNILMWDLLAVQSRSEPISRDMSKEQFDKLWKELWYDGLFEDALDKLAESSNISVDYLKKVVKPISPGDIKTLISRLDSDSFATRVQAADALKKMEFSAYEPLKDTIKKKKLSLEGESRAKMLVEYCDSLIEDEEWNRQWNAIMVLEQIGTVDARKFLKALAEGSAEAKTTKDARAALRRMNTKPQ